MSENQKKIVIVGATGLIGQHLVRCLVSEGYLVVVLTRNPSKAEKYFSQCVQVEHWNSNDIFSLTSIINGSKAVVNLAGESIAKRWTNKNKELILKSRIDTTNAIVQAIHNCSEPPEVVIQASAIGYYPNNSAEALDENVKVGNGFLSRVVMLWEQEATKVENTSRLVIIRTGIVLSSKGGFLNEIVTSIKFFLGGWFGNGEQMISWIHIEDHVRAIQFLIENSLTKGIYNLVSPEPIKYKQFARQIGKVLKRPIWIHIPVFIVKLIFGEMANEVVLSNQRILPIRLLSAGYIFRFKGIDKALKDLIGNDKSKL